MRHHAMLAGLVVSVSLATTSTRAARAQEEAIDLARRILQAHAEAVKAHDAKALAAMLDPDVDAIILSGDTLETIETVEVQGRQEAEAVYAGLFRQSPKLQVKRSVLSARFVTPEVLLTDEAYELTGLQPDVGPIRAQVVVIRKKEGGKWLTVAERQVVQVPKKP